MNPSEASIVVTGASRGLGLQFVNTFLGRGWNVFGCSRGPSEVKHERYQHFEIDVAHEKGVVHMFAAVRKSGKPLYAAVNNAGAASMNHVLTTPFDTMQKLFSVNVFGTMLCSREAAKQMVLCKRRPHHQLRQHRRALLTRRAKPSTPRQRLRSRLTPRCWPASWENMESPPTRCRPIR